MTVQSSYQPLPSTQAGGSHLVSCLRLFIQYKFIYSPYLQACSSIQNPEKASCHGENGVILGYTVFSLITLLCVHTKMRYSRKDIIKKKARTSRCKVPAPGLKRRVNQTTIDNFTIPNSSTQKHTSYSQLLHNFNDI